MKFIKNLKIATKINLLVIGILLLFSLGIGVVIQNSVAESVKDIAVKKAQSDLYLSYAAIDQEYPGSWEIRDGQLYKGDTLVNENYEMVDLIAEVTGGTVTIFQGDTRVSTNVILEDGERAINTQPSDEVIQTVLNEGNSYYGEADVLGTLTQTAYQPILDESGNPIGIWYVGESTAFIDETIASIITSLVIVLAVGAVIAAVIVYLFSKGIKKQLDNVGLALQKAGQGDFTYVLKAGSKDEFGQLSSNYNQMKDNLKELIGQVFEATETVTSQSEELTQSSNEVKAGSQQIAGTMQELASGSESQASYATNISEEMDVFAGQMQAANENGDEIYALSNNVLKMTNDGGQLMEASVEQMEKIDRIVQEAVGKVRGLDAQSQEITKLVSVIKDIADQTNLLALNAAIEAARAGEHGKGFAVVADEVRKLAEQVGGSVTDITGIVRNIQLESTAVADSLQVGYEEVEKGTNQIQVTGETFSGIENAVKEMVSSIQSVTDTLSAMTSSTNKMGSAIEEIAAVAEEAAAGVEQTSASAQQTSSSMEEISNSSEQLAELAEELNNQVRQFKF
ncbi:methyl-accepting chemotaxis protein [Evansella clarkii]|uniref:methyl-accepting chemotaxis protein n=1 Tax=Evansella clarkii TaxID=79879 RepID=UPI000B445E18|nr:methyl-accepting chemotaxis protein [Evansella clarkii]